jgi:plastocyanin
MKPFAIALALTAAAFLTGAAARAQESLTTTIKDHKFTPAEIRVPAGKRITLEVVNDDSTAEEFESSALKVEKVVSPKSKITVQFGPLNPGTYKFEGEFNSETAKGTVIAE